MELIKKKNLSITDKIQISRIWNNEYPKSLNFHDIAEFESYLASISNPDHFILQNQSNEILAWACKFERDNGKWFAVILDQKIHGKGKGTQILNVIKENENELNAWVIDKEDMIKINGENYKSPLLFYLKNHFEVVPESKFENDKMSAIKIVWKR